MMHKEEILSKGSYVHPQTPDLVSVKQYVVTRIKDKKVLFVRLNNERGETVDAVSLSVRQYNVKGELIGTDKVKLKKLNAPAYSVFAPTTPIVLSEDCSDFKIDVLSASYGDYTYDVIDGEAHIRYKKQKPETKKRVNTDALMADMGGRKHSVSRKSLKAPMLLVVICTVILAILMSFTMLQLVNYMYVQTYFTLDDFEYEFMSDNKDNGPIRIIKYKGGAYNLEIPEEVEGYPIASIAGGAFSRDTLRSITVKGDTVIENGAFENFTKLHTVKLPNVKTVGGYAFFGCKSLSTVELGGSLKEIGDRCFAECGKLKQIKLSDGLMSIGSFAFSECDKLSELVIPSSVTSLGEGIVSGCEISTLTVPFVGSTVEDTRQIAYLYGVSMNDSIPSELSSLTVTVQNMIPSYTFENCIYINSIVFDKNVTEIGDHAFYGCSELESFELTETLTYLGSYAFGDCEALKSVVIPESITEIGEGVFSDCMGLESAVIPDSVTAIGRDAFRNCRALRAIDLPSAVVSIGESAFYDCISLENVVIPFVGYSADQPTVMSDIFGTAATENIAVLRITQPLWIIDGCFSGMTSLKEIYLGNTFSEIGANAFSGCASLAKINIPSKVRSIGDGAFYGCSSLKTLNLPEGMEIIEDSLFEGCGALNYVGIPETVTSINDNAFSGCVLLDEVILPVDLTFIGQGAFTNCASLGSISIPNGITEIRPNTFSGCSGLSIVAIPVGINYIGERAFADCTALLGASLPNTLNTLEAEAFANCTSLTTFSLPFSVSALGEGVLKGCTAINTLSTHIMSADLATSGENGSIGYLFGNSYDGNLTVPSSLSSVTLSDFTVIPEGAFADCGSIQVVNLPASLTEIKPSAFRGCSSLSRIFLPDGVEIIGNEAFRDCTSLSVVSFSKQLSYINDYAFCGCVALSDVVLGSKLASIGNNAFEGCASIKSLEIPMSVEYIGASAFCGCEGLEELSVPFVGSSRYGGERFLHVFGYVSPEALVSITVQDADVIVDEAFMDVFSVKEINLNEGIVSVGRYAFMNCEALEALVIPDNTEYIGNGAFFGCNSLTELTVPFVGNYADDDSGMAEMFDHSIPPSLKTVRLTDTCQLPDYSFQNFGDIEEILIDCDVTHIGKGAFEGCRALRSAVMPDTVTHIGDWAFYDCISIKEFTIPRDIEYIGDGAFFNCFRLYEIYNNSDSYSVIAGEGADVALENGNAGYFALRVYRDGDLQEKVTQDGFSFLMSQNGDRWYLVDYTLDEGVCDLPSGFVYEGESIYGYQIPANLFREDTDIVSVRMPYSVKKLGENAFYMCGSLTEADIYSAELSSIGVSAFEGCSALTSVSVPETVTNILYRTFNGCSSLSELSLPVGLVGIEAGAFEGCSSLEAVDLPDRLTTIGDGAFAYCFELRTLDMSESIMEIGSRAFEDCSSLRSIRIYENLFYIGEDAFRGCTSLYEVYNFSPLTVTIAETDNGFIAYYAYIVHGDNAAEPLTDVTVGDLLFRKSGDNWFLCGHTSDDGELVLDPFYYEGRLVNAYSIVRYAFRDSADITALKITNAVKAVGTDAFSEHYDSIKELDLSENTLLTLEDLSWILNIRDLRAITFQPTLTELPLEYIRYFPYIEYLSFEGNQSIYEIPAYSFSNNQYLSTVILPDKLTVIGNEAFYNCDALSSITVPGTLIRIGDQAFYSCNLLNKLVLPTSLTEIGAYAFAYCSYLEEVELSGNITTLNDGVFMECDALVSADLVRSKKLKEIPYNTFNGCGSLETVTLPSGLVTIGNNAFEECSVLKNVTVPSSVKTIGNRAFANCGSLESIDLSKLNVTGSIGVGTFSDCTSLKSVSLPAGLEEIGSEMFSNCDSLTTVKFTNTIRVIGTNAFWSCDALAQINLPYGVDTIGDSAFAESPKLKRISLPATLRTIGNFAFANCGALESVDLRSGVEYIYSYAFYGCSSLKAINIPSTVCYIGDNAFAYCSSLSTIDLSNADNIGNISGYTFYECTALETVVLPDNLSKIEYDAFGRCTALKRIDLPSSVTAVGDNAFDNCTSLETVSFSESLTSIGSYAFRNCTSLISADLGGSRSLRYIYSNAFSGCTALEELILPESLVTLSDYAFMGCTSLENVSFNGRFTSIGTFAFEDCTSLKSVDLSRLNNLRYIYSSAFSGCTALEELILPEGLEEIKENAFADCESLKPIVIPSTVDYIGYSAFIGCTGLYEIWNMSKYLSLVPGSTSNGYVAAYAVAVHTEMDEDLALQYTELNKGSTVYGFYYNTEDRYLVSITNAPAGEILMLPDTEGVEYTVSRLAAGEGMSYSYMFVPYEVISMDQAFINRLGGYMTVYYKGTPSDWNNRVGSTVSVYSLYTYVECKHDYDSTWMYGEDGNITTEVCPTKEEITEATCVKTGTVKHICERCGVTVSTDILELVNHQYDDSYKCTVCSKEMSETEKIAYKYMSFGTGYTFVLDKDGNLVSNNRGYAGTDAEAVFTADGKMTVSFVYSVSSESGYDFLRIFHNEDQLDEISGNVRKTASLTLEEGDRIRFVYLKDGSHDYGDDCGMIYDITVEYIVDEPTDEPVADPDPADDPAYTDETLVK